MAESQILSQFWKRKKRNISFPDWPVKAWLFFKSQVVEDVEIVKLIKLSNINSRIQFRKLITPVISRGGPRGTRGKVYSKTKRSELISICWWYFQQLFAEQLPYEVGTSELGGVGIFWKKTGKLVCADNGTVESLTQLVGFIIYIVEEDFEILLSHNYPSLYRNNYILIGPLSLVNHHCQSSLGFTTETRRHQIAEFADICMVQLRFLEVDTAVESVEGAEILVKYSNEKPVWCTC
jgi:hypothetical protein